MGGWYDGAVRDDQLQQLLRARNPWWRSAQLGTDPLGWASSDPVLSAAMSTSVRYDPDPLPDLHPGGLWVLWGPRRVGKSVALRRALAHLLDPKAAGWTLDGRSVVALSCDGLSAADLRRVLTLGRQARGEIDGPRCWLLDEVTAIPGWEAILKEARDQTSLATDAVVLSGSSASSFAAARTMLGAGRAGDVADPFRVLLPMSFRDFVAQIGLAIPSVPVLTPDALQGRAAKDAVLACGAFVDDLDLAWQRYLSVGGFPRAVGDALQTGDVGAAFVSDLLAWLIGDVEPGGAAESVAALLAAIERRSAAPLDVSDLARSLDSTRDRVATRVQRLLASFAAIECRQVDDRGAARSGTRPKLYPSDPLLGRLPSLHDPRFAAPDVTRATEAALAVHLAVAIDRLHPDRLIEQAAIGHLRTTTGNEIDLAPVPIAVGGMAVTSVAIEAKWVSNGWKPEARTLVGRLGSGVVATKSITDTNGPVWAVPAPVVALLLR